ncbi:MAG: MBL fold metallo-hydrolase [Deltaproteobacteria bacterium]|nr:MBL fold metallo-hydrolase [Deltaproteobacteria bacterium]
MKGKWLVFLVFIFVVSLGSSLAWAQTVKVTPLGAEANRFCVGDRALLFEDPTGVRVLIAPGRTVGADQGTFVRGSADPRLGGSLHVLLIDHPHVDHIGDVFHTTCAGAPTKAFEFPGEGNAPEIAARLNSAVLVGGELPDFFTQKIKNVTGVAPAGCPAAGLDNTFTVPRSAPCVGVIRGGTRTAVSAGQTTGVKITTIPAFHAAGASRAHVDELVGLGGGVVADPGIPAGLTGYAGAETGYILRFTNGLSVLWTGDSGLIGDWATQATFYRVNLAVVHGGDLFTMGPDEAAFAVNQLIKPRSVIPEHFNQVSTTTTGAVNAGTRLERFINLLTGQSQSRVVVPLSGATFEFDGAGNCVAGPGC